MRQYLDLLKEVNIWGDEIEGRNGTTREVFGLHAEYDLSAGFPLVTTKKMAIQSILGELIGFIRGYCDVQDFKKLGCNIWDQNAAADYWVNSDYMKLLQKDKTDGYLGRIYGVQWRNWVNAEGTKTDQLLELIEGIKKDPQGRRHIVTAFNPGELEMMCLPPCHMFFQVNITKNHQLDLMMYQRSADMFLGVPYNIASYAFLMLILCHQTGYTPGKFIHNLGSAHIYSDHYEQVEEQLNRMPHALPLVTIDPDLSSDCALEDYEPEHFIITNYNHEPAIKAKMSV